MHVNFSQIVHFTRLVKTGGRLREFNFRKLKAEGEELFNVDTVDDRGNRILFRMHKRDGNWSVSSEQPLPQWIADNVSLLGDELDQGVINN